MKRRHLEPVVARIVRPAWFPSVRTEFPLLKAEHRKRRARQQQKAPA